MGTRKANTLLALLPTAFSTLILEYIPPVCYSE